MSAVSANLVKELREKTGAGMMDCKKALTETQGDLEAAVDWLRKKGISSASKKSGRVAAEGKVVVASEGNHGLLLEVNSETDFAAKNEKFMNFIQTAVQAGLEAKVADIEAMAAVPYPGAGHSVGEELTALIAGVGENMNLRRVVRLEAAQGVVVGYLHMGGKIGTLVSLESAAADQEVLRELGKKIAMHVAASTPLYLNRDAVPGGDLDRERDVLADQARASGKPESIIEKMVQGRLSKFYGETCLVEQPFVMDPEQTVQAVVDAAAKSLGAPIRVAGFARFMMGEGLQKRDDDFAAEVAKQVGQ
ncbi:Elongation factor Ts [Candidatus Magnetaquicoccaceae bacterium FCR-1]|uniref:Elongation factor Ts n=1 Tax=Candidatus Magnetaquiglobus chichijimensis TaxID=3141448 RepID=A0ABQ0C632_9PROT